MACLLYCGASMSKVYSPDPRQFPEIVGLKGLEGVKPPEGFKGQAFVYAPILKLTQKQANLDMVNETVEWITEEKLVPSLMHALLHVLN